MLMDGRTITSGESPGLGPHKTRLLLQIQGTERGVSVRDGHRDVIDATEPQLNHKPNLDQHSYSVHTTGCSYI